MVGEVNKEGIFVFRVGHRVGRDERASTHLFLAARALGATGAYYSGQRDCELESRLKRVVGSWGGHFFLEYVGEGWKMFLDRWKKIGGTIVHLTMYGERVGDVLGSIGDRRPLLIVVGGAKVSYEVYGKADFNVAIGNQPHSEIAAVAIFLDRYLKGEWEAFGFEKARIKIVPSKMGKKVIECKK
ncbi:MAG: tRNA (cytidine(56)-2'-O)-methyltransferase [Candidatus Anstonellales archaeon]